jgi:hypothetical protein
MSVKIRFCILALLVAITNISRAQEDTTAGFLTSLSDWTVLYAISTDDFLQEERSLFQVATGKRPYITATMQTDHWLLSRLNRVTELRYDHISPSAFDIRLSFLQIEPGKYDIQAQMSDDEEHDLSAIETQFNEHYKNNPLQLSRIMEDLSPRIIEAWDTYQQQYPDESNAKLYIRQVADGAVFSNGETMEVDPEFGETIEVELLNSNFEVITAAQSQWQNASPYENKAIVDLRNRQEVTVTGSTYRNTVSVVVRKKQGLLELKEQIKVLLTEILESKRAQVLARIDSLRSDSSSLISRIRAVQDSINRANIPMIEIEGFQSAGVFSMYESPVALSNQEERRFYDVPQLKRGADNIREYLILRQNLRRQVNIVGFINLVVDDPKRLLVLVEDLILNSGQLLGQLLTGTDAEDNRTTARNIIVAFVNQRLLAISSGT